MTLPANPIPDHTIDPELTDVQEMTSAPERSVAPEGTLTQERTIAQLVLMAGSKLEVQGHMPFSAEALIVASWHISPKAFGLKGFAEQYPDSNRVLSVIMGERGLARQGLLEKVGVKLYTLSERGRKLVARLESPDTEEPLEKVKKETKKKMTKDMERFLERVTASLALTRYRTGAKRDITFRDACDFWGVVDRADIAAVQAAARRMPGTLSQIEQVFEGDKLQLSNGRQVSREEMQTLTDLHDFVTEQFSRHLNIVRPKK